MSAELRRVPTPRNNTAPLLATYPLVVGCGEKSASKASRAISFGREARKRVGQSVSGFQLLRSQSENRGQ